MGELRWLSRPAIAVGSLAASVGAVDHRPIYAALPRLPGPRREQPVAPAAPGPVGGVRRVTLAHRPIVTRFGGKVMAERARTNGLAAHWSMQLSAAQAAGCRALIAEVETLGPRYARHGWSVYQMPSTGRPARYLELRYRRLDGRLCRWQIGPDGQVEADNDFGRRPNLSPTENDRARRPLSDCFVHADRTPQSASRTTP
jgi:hypothetical protein